jgi:hypothetical protein
MRRDLRDTRVEPEVNGSNWPSARVQNRSVIAVGKMRNSTSTVRLTTPSMTRPARFRSRSSVRLASRCSQRPMAHPCRWLHTTIRPSLVPRALAAASAALARALILSPSSTLAMMPTVCRLAFGMSAATKSTQRIGTAWYSIANRGGLLWRPQRLAAR